MQRSEQLRPFPFKQLASPPLAVPASRLLTRIMSVDDGAVDQMVCKRVIRRSGLAEEVVSMTTPAAALSYLGQPNNPQIDLILLDVNMPGMDGFEFLAAAHNQLVPGQKLPPVLVMLSTAMGPLHKKEAGKFDVIKGYLDKPLDRGALEQAILNIQKQPDPQFVPLIL